MRMEVKEGHPTDLLCSVVDVPKCFCPGVPAKGKAAESIATENASPCWLGLAEPSCSCSSCAGSARRESR